MEPHFAPSPLRLKSLATFPMISSKPLLADLKKQVTLLENDLRKRCNEHPEVDAPLRAAYDAAKAGKRTAATYNAWRDEQLTQIAVAWVLACVFVRFLEDNGLVEVPKLAGPGALGLRARDEHELYFREHPTLTEREYLESVFTETGTLPAMREFFDRRHNPLWQCGPSGDAAAALLDFWRKTDPDSGRLLHDFTDPEWNTRFLGDLYQDLSEAARKKYALLQTPDFIEEFILDRTLGPAIDTFGYRVVRMIDPTCGSGHFLLGGFGRLFRIWQRENPGENPRVLAQRALDAIHGVDLNPYAVAIARFRLLLAALQVSGIGKLRNAPDFTIHLASGDALLHGRRFREMEGESRRQTLFETDGEIFRDELKHHYEVEDGEALHRILGQQYHAVVGNPPYITVKDKALSELYRARFSSCHRQYSLSVPFMERFFDLAIKGDATPQQPAGFVGTITGNSFIKAEFGRKLIEESIPHWDITHVIDTAGAYIPGHGTPTVIMFGKNQRPVATTIRTVMGIKGEPDTPKDPSAGLVWLAITRQVDRPDTSGEFVDVADIDREGFHKHPWSIGGGGAAELKASLDLAGESRLGESIEVIGRSTHTGENEAFVFDDSSARTHGLADFCVQYVVGEDIRNFVLSGNQVCVFPYEQTSGKRLPTLPFPLFKHFWPMRALLRKRKDFGEYIEDRGLSWWDHSMFFPERYRSPLSLAQSFVASHNHFALDRGRKVFNQTAPVIKLPIESTETDHLILLGLLNSSTACFWLKQVCFPKGGDQQGAEGARVRTTLWDERYNYNSTPVNRFPIPSRQTSQLPTALVKYSTALQAQSPAATLASWSGSQGETLPDRLTCVRDLAANHRRKLIAWQEELDWQIYEAFGLVEAAAESGSDAVSLPEGEAMDAIPPEGIELGQRAFEIVLARRMAAGEVETTWFTRHGSTPITEIPAHWPAAYRELVERRIRRIESDANIRLIEQPEYKRRWNTEPWDDQLKRAATEWLLLRLETYFHGSERMTAGAGDQGAGDQGSGAGQEARAASSDLQSTILNHQSSISSSLTAATRPHLTSANQLAEVVQADPLFLEVAECLEGSSGFSVAKLVQRLVEAESVPALPRDRYKDSGLRKREDWEETWRLQRLEDAVEAETRGKNPETREEVLKTLIRNEQVARVGEIPVPPKYGSGDFKKTSYWKLRGKLDVPKERWICYPGAERDGDPSPLIAWAGWDHLQQAQALAEYFLDAKDAHGWPPSRLKPLLSALADLLPWLKQWHNAPDPNLGMGLGDYFQGFVEEQCRALETTLQEIDAERLLDKSEPAPRPARKAATKRGRKPKADVPDDDAEELAAAVPADGPWQDQAFRLLAPRRQRITHYRPLVWPELLKQAPGELEFETFRKAYWLLSEPAELERIGKELLPDLPASWWRSRREVLAKNEFLDSLKGSVTLGDLKIWRKDGVRYIQWTGSATPGQFPEAIDDARVALQAAELWVEDEPVAERDAIEREVRELETA
jgi:hypothetical protein